MVSHGFSRLPPGSGGCSGLPKWFSVWVLIYMDTQRLCLDWNPFCNLDGYFPESSNSVKEKENSVYLGHSMETSDSDMSKLPHSLNRCFPCCIAVMLFALNVNTGLGICWQPYNSFLQSLATGHHTSEIKQWFLPNWPCLIICLTAVAKTLLL